MILFKTPRLLFSLLTESVGCCKQSTTFKVKFLYILKTTTTKKLTDCKADCSCWTMTSVESQPNPIGNLRRPAHTKKHSVGSCLVCCYCGSSFCCSHACFCDDRVSSFSRVLIFNWRRRDWTRHTIWLERRPLLLLFSFRHSIRDDLLWRFVFQAGFFVNALEAFNVLG